MHNLKYTSKHAMPSTQFECMLGIENCHIKRKINVQIQKKKKKKKNGQNQKKKSEEKEQHNRHVIDMTY